MVLAALADGQRAAGTHADALGAVESGLAAATETGQHGWGADLYRLKGALLLDTHPANAAEAEALFGRALDIARAQEAKSFELRAATSLARLWQREGKRVEARARWRRSTPGSPKASTRVTSSRRRRCWRSCDRRWSIGTRR